MAVILKRMGWTNKKHPALNDQNLEQMEDNIEEAINKSLEKNSTKITVEKEIEQNINYEVPAYIVGTNSLSIYFEGSKLIKDLNYIEIDTTHIQFKDWNVPVGSNLEIITRREEK